tara:strand:- start:709 stop:1092 length:384 start_codon:yes stop_codon:yes gene_type:complete
MTADNEWEISLDRVTKHRILVVADSESEALAKALDMGGLPLQLPSDGGVTVTNALHRGGSPVCLEHKNEMSFAVHGEVKIPFCEICQVIELEENACMFCKHTDTEWDPDKRDWYCLRCQNFTDLEEQ